MIKALWCLMWFKNRCSQFHNFYHKSSSVTRSTLKPNRMISNERSTRETFNQPFRFNWNISNVRSLATNFILLSLRIVDASMCLCCVVRILGRVLRESASLLCFCFTSICFCLAKHVRSHSTIFLPFVWIEQKKYPIVIVVINKKNCFFFHFGFN